MVTSDLPNIILIISDALRPQDLSLYGYDKETDKNIKKIASDSLVFENNFSASNASDPSVNSIFIGKYPVNNGIIHQHPNMSEEEFEKLKKNTFWLPLYLQSRGYFTISATPLHMWFKKGFNYYMDRDPKEMTKKFLNYPIINKFLLKLPSGIYSFGKKIIKTRASPNFYSCKEVMDLAISKIEESKKPFFLFMHFVDTHSPYSGATFKSISGERTIKKISAGMNSLQREYLKKRFHDMSVKNIEEVIEKRDNAIRQVDEQIGRLHKLLKEKNLWENTVFIITSDHGDNFGENNSFFCRGGLHDSSVHTPLIIHGPKIKSGVINNITQSIDLAPTILEILRDKQKKLDGISLLKIVNGTKKREYAFLSDGFCKNRRAIRTEDRKLILSEEGGNRCYVCGAFHGSGSEEYDLKNDPEEKNNIYSGKRKLEEELNSYKED